MIQGVKKKKKKKKKKTLKSGLLVFYGKIKTRKSCEKKKTGCDSAAQFQNMQKIAGKPLFQAVNRQINNGKWKLSTFWFWLVLEFLAFMLLNVHGGEMAY